MLEEDFSLKKKKHHVAYKDELLSWTDVDKASQKKSVHLSDIIAVNLEGASQDKKSLIVHYIQGHPKHLWTCEKAQFEGDHEQSVWETWWQTLRDALQQQKRPKKLLIFINPTSGSKKNVKIYESTAAPLFNLADVVTDVVVTKDAKHAEELLSTYDLTSIDGIVCMGGDGTLLQVFNAYYKRFAKDEDIDLNDPLSQHNKRVPLPFGLICGGTGNGKSTWLTGTKDPLTCVLHIIKGHQVHDTQPMMTVYNGAQLRTMSFLFSGGGVLSDVQKCQEERRYTGTMRALLKVGEALWQFRSRNIKVLYLKENGEWEAIEKPMKGYAAWLFDVDKEKKETIIPPTMIVRLMGECSRMALMKYLSGMISLRANMLDGDGLVEEIRGVQEVKFIWPEDTKLEEEPITVDGENLFLQDNTLHCKFVPSLFSMYGEEHPMQLK